MIETSDRARPVESATDGGEWVRSFGRQWKIDITIMAIVVFLFGAIRPLADPDLPMHLAIGEWIVRNHRVPFVEPFSWTAAGQPYFAYSWLPQSLYYWILSAFGSYGLRALQGLLVLSSAWAALVLARAAQWRPSLGVMLAGFNLIVAAFFVAMLRPQSVLLITMPLIWAMFIAIAAGRATWRAVPVLFVASALTANSHLFFPITMAPAVVLWVHRRLRSRLAIAGIVAVLAGWMSSPYASNWLRVYRHNFGSHILTRPPSAITELQPGFVVMLQPPLGPLLVLVVGMLAVPWILGQARLEGRERQFAAVYWVGGVVLFGFAVRLFVIWWVLALLPVGWALAQLARNTHEAPPRLGFRVFGLVACVVVIGIELSRTQGQRALEGSTTDRVLPTYGALPAERVARWLASNTVPGARGRIMTSFAYGSYLTWRLPGYSASIDSRGLQPDSVAAAEAMVSAATRDMPLGPWRSADLAIVPVRYRAAAALDTASGWRRLIAVPGDPITADSAGLWVRDAWWSRNGLQRSSASTARRQSLDLDLSALRRDE